MNKPIQKERYENRVKRIVEHCDPNAKFKMCKIAPLFVMEMELAIEAYHGGKLRAAWHLLRSGLKTWVADKWNEWTIQFSDWMGWTTLYHIPASDKWLEHHRRHGRYCPAVNPRIANVPPNPTADCGLNCIRDSLPWWFRKLTGRTLIEGDD